LNFETNEVTTLRTYKALRRPHGGVQLLSGDPE
jgi:hypothetical protein